MTDLADRLMSLWSTPVPADEDEALAAFGAVYTDPLALNGTTTTLRDLVARARSTQGTFGDLRHQLLERVDAPDRLVIAFRLHGTHTGPLATPVGTVAATGRPVYVRVIDILTLSDGRVSSVVVVADELGMLHGLGALALAAP